MARTHINFRTWAALILLSVLIAVFVAAGNWQLDRAAQRDAIAEHIANAADYPSVALSAATPQAELIAWRQAHANGQWLHRYTVLLENRNYNTRPGYWVATPLRLDQHTDSADAPGKAVLVLRGWLPRESVIQPSSSGAPAVDPDLARLLARPSGEQSLQGELLSHIPRALELWTWTDDAATLPARITDTRTQLPAVQNVDLDDYARATGLDLLPIVLAQTGASGSASSPDMVRDWPRPSSDSDTNRGYALQWFSFCAIAVGAWLFIAWRMVRLARASR